MLHSRRTVIAGLALGVAGCAVLPPLSVEEAVRRLLRRATERALARLEAPGGVWDHLVADVDFGALPPTLALTLRGSLLSGAFRRQLDAWLRPIALRAARAAAPRIAAAIRVMGIARAREVLAGGPHAATDLLRSEMGPAVLEAMLPEFTNAIALLDDPVLGPLIRALAGAAGEALAHRFARAADRAVWDAIAQEEAAIRGDPTAGGDPDLARMLAHP